MKINDLIDLLKPYDNAEIDQIFLKINRQIVIGLKPGNESIPMDAEVGMPSENSFGQWIDAESIFPEQEQRILMYVDRPEYFDTNIITGYYEDGFYRADNHLDMTDHTAKWMPLPKP